MEARTANSALDQPRRPHLVAEYAGACVSTLPKLPP